MRKSHLALVAGTLLFILVVSPMVLGQGKPRARDLGISFEGMPGPLNAITDVTGVEVGHSTIISGEGELKVGLGPIRTGVTAILPRGKQSSDPVFAGWFSLNGNGEMTGTTRVEESGFLEGPILITNSHSVEPDLKNQRNARLLESPLSRGQNPARAGCPKPDGCPLRCVGSSYEPPHVVWAVPQIST